MVVVVVAYCWLFVVCCWLFVVCCWLLVVGCLLFVVRCWSLVVLHPSLGTNIDPHLVSLSCSFLLQPNWPNMLVNLGILPTCWGGEFLKLPPTLPETNSLLAPTNGWLEYDFPIREAYFQGRTVSFRDSSYNQKKHPGVAKNGKNKKNISRTIPNFEVRVRNFLEVLCDIHTSSGPCFGPPLFEKLTLPYSWYVHFFSPIIMEVENG